MCDKSRNKAPFRARDGRGRRHERRRPRRRRASERREPNNLKTILLLNIVDGIESEQSQHRVRGDANVERGEAGVELQRTA